MRVSDIDGLAVPLAGLKKRPPVTCPPGEPTRGAIERMQRLGVGSVIIVDEAGRALGIVTRRDVVDRVALRPSALSDPVSRVMTPDPIALPAHATAYDAALVMVKHGMRHIVLSENGRVAGVVSERDLFGLQSADVRQLSVALRGAQDLEAIERFGQDINRLALQMHSQGVAVWALTAFIASLNDLLTHRVIDFEFARSGIDAQRCCWIVMGSEGRSEQTLLTDQDNGIVFRPRPGRDIEAERSEILPAARRINEALDRAGYRLCTGQIMASNPKWTLSLDEWQRKFEQWIEQGSPEALLHGAIFFDLRPLYGALELGADLRAWLCEHAPRNPRFLHQMAGNALKNAVPIGWFGRLAAGADGRIDTKVNGAGIFTDAARIYALAHGLDEVNTERRLRAAQGPLGVAAGEVAAWIGAFHFVQGARLRRQAECLNSGTLPDNRVDPRTLHDFDRRTLLEAFRQARTLQRRLALDYRV